jgi:hypothetical protein
MFFAFVAMTSGSWVHAQTEIIDYTPEFQDVLSGTHVVTACQEGPRSRQPGFSNYECGAFISRKRKMALAAKELQPEDCEDSALYEGFGAPEFDMGASLTGGVGKVVKFWGKILNGEEGAFVVFNSRASANAVVHFNSSTTLFDDIQVGGDVLGYGRVSGRQAVKLASGRETQIPVIDALCLQ